MTMTPEEGMIARKLVRVEFYDSTHDPSWQKEGTDFGLPSICYAVGWLISSSRKHLTLAMMRSEGGNCSERMLIPKGSIIRTVELADKILALTTTQGGIE